LLEVRAPRASESRRKRVAGLLREMRKAGNKVTKIRLTRGLFSIVDDIDSDLARFKWCAVKAGRYPPFFYYAQRRKGRNLVFLHQVIAARINIEGEADHRDRDGLNNQRRNLRPATRSQNTANQRMRVDNTTGFRGIAPWNGRWRAHVTVNRKQKHLGMFDTPEEAARARDIAALAAFGEFAQLNFSPSTGELQSNS